MRAIVTGGAGFIGSHVVDYLIERGHEVVVIDDLSGGRVENVNTDARFIMKSVLADDLSDIFDAFSPDVVYHLAAYAAEGLSHHIPVFNYEDNLGGTARVLACAYRSKAHFVFTSSIAAYGHGDRAFTESDPLQPCDPYGVAKAACEQHIKAFCEYYGKGMSYTILRPHNVFGERQNVADPYRNVVGIFMRQCVERKPLTIFGDGEQTRSFSYIDSVARAIAEAGLMPGAKNQVYNVGGEEVWTVNELAKSVAAVMGVVPEIQYLKARKEVAHAHCDHLKAKLQFGVVDHPVSVAKGLMEMGKWVKGLKRLPMPTECPAPIEILDGLPEAWLNRLIGKRLPWQKS